MVFINAREHSYTVNEEKNCEKASRREHVIQDFKESPDTGSFAQPNYMCIG